VEEAWRHRRGCGARCYGGTGPVGGGASSGIGAAEQLREPARPVGGAAPGASCGRRYGAGDVLRRRGSNGSCCEWYVPGARWQGGSGVSLKAIGRGAGSGLRSGIAGGEGVQRRWGLQERGSAA